ncbi:MAG TPA: proline dehydrogenase family protein [bacterium]|nr:proline dehydrogenase family protein [bacterium]
MLRQLFLYLSENPGVHKAVLNLGPARRAAARFVAGEELADAIAAVRDVNTRGMTASLDHLGEKVADLSSAQLAAADYRQILDEIARRRVDCNVSLKLTQLGLDVDPAACGELLRDLVAAARDHGNFVRIDMESSAYIDRTLELYRGLRADGRDNVGVVLQSYLFRTERDLDALLPLAPRVRLVKGAYAEPPAVAFPRKADADAAFARLSERLLDAAPYPAIATHDEALIDHTKTYARSRGISADRFEFQMLYGIRRDVQARLVAEGYRMRVYVPFGRQWFPYFMRRLAERPANVGFVLRSLVSERRRS